eukprot:5305226-Alexandrium_andersonii.AAC.1
MWPTMTKATFLCLLDQQPGLTVAWGRGHGRDVVAAGEVSLYQVKGAPGVSAGHNFLRGSTE